MIQDFFALFEGMTAWQIAGEFIGGACVFIAPFVLALVYVAAGGAP